MKQFIPLQLSQPAGSIPKKKILMKRNNAFKTVFAAAYAKSALVVLALVAAMNPSTSKIILAGALDLGMGLAIGLLLGCSAALSDRRKKPPAEFFYGCAGLIAGHLPTPAALAAAVAVKVAFGKGAILLLVFNLGLALGYAGLLLLRSRNSAVKA